MIDGSFILENLIMPRLEGLSYSSNSSVAEIDGVANSVMQDKLEVIKSYIGEELFEQLSYSDKIFMSETAGSIDFGHPVDLDRVSKDIAEYENHQG